MKTTAEVIIIGAGVIGTSIAYNLAKAGCHEVLVLEKDIIGGGSTSKAAGGVRQQFSTEVNISLSIESITFFQNFEDEIGHPVDLRQCGYLFLFCTEQDGERFRQNVALQRSLGVKVELLSPKEVKDIIPKLNTEDVLGATYCPTDGIVDPHSVVQGFASAARKLGVRICQDTEVIDISMSKGKRVRGVLTNSGEVAAPIVVDAAGPYAGQVGKMAGLDIPIRPNKQQVFFSAPSNEIQKDAPFIIDVSTGFGFRRERQVLMLQVRDEEAPEGFDTNIDWGYLWRVGEIMVHRLPFLENVGIMRAQAGLHEDSPDGSAILGQVSEIEGLYLACGLSGHGVMHSPAVGRLMAEYILGKESGLTISALSLSRFKEGERFQSFKTFI